MASTAASSSASQVGCLPLVDCPKCKVQVVKRKSKAGNVYYTCPNNFLNDDTCKKYWFEDQYLEYLRTNHPDKLGDVAVEGVQGPFVAPAVQGIEQRSDRKLEMMDMKVQISDLKVDICKLKEEIKELKNGGLNKSFSLGNALVAGVVAVVMLNLFVSLLVAAVRK